MTKRKAPVETTSRKPVSRFKQVVKVNKRESHDPRFSNAHGTLNRWAFKKDYDWLYRMKDTENVQMEAQYKSLRRKGSKTDAEWIEQERLKKQLDRARAEKKMEEREEKEWQMQQQYNESVGRKGGHWFLKKSEKKEIETVQKFKNLQKANKLEDWMAKKRKHHASKDAEAMPSWKS